MNLDELERLCEAATPGEWWALIWGTTKDAEGYLVADTGVVSESGVSICKAPRYAKRSEWDNDAAFIAAARTALPQLLRRVRELEGHRPYGR